MNIETYKSFEITRTTNIAHEPIWCALPLWEIGNCKNENTIKELSHWTGTKKELKNTINTLWCNQYDALDLPRIREGYNVTINQIIDNVPEHYRNIETEKTLFIMPVIAANVPQLSANPQGCYISSYETYEDWTHVQFHVHREGQFVASFSLTKGEAFEGGEMGIDALLMEGYRGIGQ
jgi:hypothetical protein